MSHSSFGLHPDHFAWRHLGPRADDLQHMLETVGFETLDGLIDAAVPADIRLDRALDLPAARSERTALDDLAARARENRVWRSLIGMGYADCVVPPVILRNILENPGWYTAYTPYQAEISQGRLEALLNYQTMVSDLTGLEVSNASLLDEATAAAEAMSLCYAVARSPKDAVFVVDERCHPQTIAVVETRATARGIAVAQMDTTTGDLPAGTIGVLLQYPGSDGEICDYRDVVARAHEDGALVVVATDLLALLEIEAPGAWGADIAVGNSQRFGVPLGYGGPHAAFFATREQFKRHVPGRIIGVTKDTAGRLALRMALQTREQHIRREKATSNVCTAQVLLAVIAGMYAVYHGPQGLARIARRVHAHARRLAASAAAAGLTVVHQHFFDTVCVEGEPDAVRAILDRAAAQAINLRQMSDRRIGITLDERTTDEEVATLAGVLGGQPERDEPAPAIPDELRRQAPYLLHPVFSRYHAETEMLRYLKRLENKDLSLAHAMIPLGSCTMKLNATAEMAGVTWPEFGSLHPFVPRDQAEGYAGLFTELETWLAEITGFAAISLQPNAGSQGEYAGLLVINAYHVARGDTERNVCLIPQSAHGTNPASAVMAGLRVVPVKTDPNGNIDMDDLRAKTAEHADHLAALMITYPSTHGVFEGTIRDICDLVHDAGGQVYMDGANLNALVGISRPGDIGADVCHLNLHKTFCIPHGGGGPGMGPIGVAAHLAPFLPDHPVVPLGIERPCGTVSAAPWGSPSILPISWAYIAMMGAEGLTRATEVAILSANYIAKRLQGHYELLYAGQNGLIAHECIIDTRPFKQSAGVEVEDIAKRLMDYGFHAPTISFPVPGTMMIEPTESESLEELDRFCDALIAIRAEIRAIEDGTADRERNVLRMAPHTTEDVATDDWDRPYSRDVAAFPSPETRIAKLWPTVGRIDAAYGDRHLMCTCPPLEEYAEAADGAA
jgi:glycine dehydrogenase